MADKGKISTVEEALEVIQFTKEKPFEDYKTDTNIADTFTYNEIQAQKMPNYHNYNDFIQTEKDRANYLRDYITYDASFRAAVAQGHITEESGFLFYLDGQDKKDYVITRNDSYGKPVKVSGFCEHTTGKTYVHAEGRERTYQVVAEELYHLLDGNLSKKTKNYSYLSESSYVGMNQFDHIDIPRQTTIRIFPKGHPLHKLSKECANDFLLTGYTEGAAASNGLSSEDGIGRSNESGDIERFAKFHAIRVGEEIKRAENDPNYEANFNSLTSPVLDDLALIAADYYPKYIKTLNAINEKLGLEPSDHGFKLPVKPKKDDPNLLDIIIDNDGAEAPPIQKVDIFSVDKNGALVINEEAFNNASHIDFNFKPFEKNLSDISALESYASKVASSMNLSGTSVTKIPDLSSYPNMGHIRLDDTTGIDISSLESFDVSKKYGGINFYLSSDSYLHYLESFEPLVENKVITLIAIQSESYDDIYKESEHIIDDIKLLKEGRGEEIVSRHKDRYVNMDQRVALEEFASSLQAAAKLQLTDSSTLGFHLPDIEDVHESNLEFHRQLLDGIELVKQGHNLEFKAKFMDVSSTYLRLLELQNNVNGTLPAKEDIFDYKNKKFGHLDLYRIRQVGDLLGESVNTALSDDDHIDAEEYADIVAKIGNKLNQDGVVDQQEYRLGDHKLKPDQARTVISKLDETIKQL